MLYYRYVLILILLLIVMYFNTNTYYLTFNIYNNIALSMLDL